VHVDSTDQADTAVDVLRANAARSLERADGLWRHGHWVDFDPVGKPQTIDGDATHRRR
jgi:hypothetical protein